MTMLPSTFARPEQDRGRLQAQTLQDGTPPATPCSSSLNGEAAATCQAYTAYTHYLYGAYYSLEGAAVAVYTTVSKNNPTLATEIWHGVGLVADVIAGMCNEFDTAIADLNDGKPFTYVAPPSSLPDFPPPPGTDTSSSVAADAVEAIWGAVDSALSVAVNKMTPGSTLQVILAGALENGQNAFDTELKPLLQQILGS